MQITIRIATLCMATALLATGNAWSDDDDGLQQSRNGNQLRKEALINAEAPDFTGIFNWGLRIKNFKELILFAGHAAQTPDFQVVAPGDAVVQTDFILDQLDHFLGSNDLDRDDIIRIEFTMTKNVSDEQFNEILGRFGGYFAEVEVKPAAGTLRFVEALAFPGMEVEYEIWMAQ